MTFADIDKVTQWMKQHDGVHALPDEKARPLGETLRKYLESNPILIQYMQHIEKPLRAINNQPWHALGERCYAAYMCLAASMSDKIKISIKPGLNREGSMVSLAYMIMGCLPYLWTGSMEKLADAAPLPKHVVSRKVMPHPTMFWSRDTAYLVRDEHANLVVENNWLALFYSGDKMIVVGDLFNETTGQMEIYTGMIPFGKTWPHDYDYDRITFDQSGRILKRCAFLTSPYVDKELHRLPRHHRRQMQRAGIPTPQINEEISVVTLRRRGIGSQQNQPQQFDEGIEWKHQWWVSAHYRAQWYPSEEAHRVIWIAPYLKGPQGLPVLEKVYAVVR